jgi:hypothetical protein
VPKLFIRHPKRVFVDPLSGSILKGKLFNALSKFLISPRNYLEIAQAVGTYMRKDWGNMAMIVFFLKPPFPLARKYTDDDSPIWIRNDANKCSS